MSEQLTFEELMDRHQDIVQDLYADMHDKDEFNPDHVYVRILNVAARMDYMVIDLDDIDYEDFINTDYTNYVQEAL